MRMTSKRVFTTFAVNNIDICKQQLLSWVSRFSSCCFMDNHGYVLPGGQWECLAGAGALEVLSAPSGGAFDALAAFHAQHGDWLFGHLGYDLKNEVEELGSALPDPLGFPDLRFFVPRFVFLMTGSELRIGVREDDNATEIWEAIREIRPAAPASAPRPGARASAATAAPKTAPELKARFTREEYLNTVHHLQDHIHRGDCYEITFCQEFFLENATPDPVTLYRELETLSPHPHGAYYAFDEQVLCCASPERYLQHLSGRLLSQPMKGTIARDKDPIGGLRDNPKERSENIMIVDLVRNDLSRVCTEGSVRASEICGIYPFPQVFQMISSVEGCLEGPWIAALKATFPMGSMTGAPKKRALELIEQYERTRRGLYSGALGYIDPQGNFDFGVVIRSLLYNKARKYLSFSVGSAITAASDPAGEYAECLLKAEGIKKALEKVFPSAI